MTNLNFTKITLADLRQRIQLQELPGTDHPWLQVDEVQLSDREQTQLQEIQSHLINTQIHLFNEATIWARAIYPLLLLAEQGQIQVWSKVPLKATYAQFSLEGIVDGVLGTSIAGRVEVPYLVIVETKRGVEGTNPVFQLYGQLLAAARLNWENDGQAVQVIFGCYTIADSWTFVRGEVRDLEGDRPHLQVSFSGEYTEKTEMATILKILKQIVAQSCGVLG
jgi:hypothetical protein